TSSIPAVIAAGTALGPIDFSHPIISCQKALFASKFTIPESLGSPPSCGIRCASLWRWQELKALKQRTREKAPCQSFYFKPGLTIKLKLQVLATRFVTRVLSF